MTSPTPTARTSLLRRTGVAGVCILLLAAGCTPGTGPDDAGSGGRSQAAPAAESGTVFDQNSVAPLVDQMVHKSPKDLQATRLADGLIPPTNKWFSGLVFGEQAQPVFPLPLSFGLTDDGVAFGEPRVTTSAKNIMGSYTPDIKLGMGAKTTTVSAYDDLTVTLESADAGGEVVGHTVIAQGSPVVTFTAAKDTTLSTGVPFAADGDAFSAKAGDVTYGLVGATPSGTSVEVNKGDSVSFFVVPQGSDVATMAPLAKAGITGGQVGYATTGTSAETTLHYRTAGKAKTVFALMPHAKNNSGAQCDLGTYPSIYGDLQVCQGTDVTWQVPQRPATGELDLSGLSGAEKDELTKAVQADIKATKPFPADTYFGGKALYRSAMLYRLATQLDLPEADQLKATLTAELDKWTDPKGCDQREAFCFVYDPKAKGVVGMTPSFGSDEFNDHHFHYGYFLYTAGVLAADDPSLADKYAPVMNLLAADLATDSDSTLFPTRRNFDAYAGHSWASGTAPFADGNNQESSSEAVTAWTGLSLWAEASKNADLETEASWMLSSEAQSGLDYWTNTDTSAQVFQGYEHKIVPLNWGGKRDYATWFSPEPAAMLGILVIPMSPASTYLAGDPERITANVEEATGGKYDQKFGDYLLMYSALAGDEQRKNALDKARGLSDEFIDDGNSRSYLLAWLMTVKA